MAKPVDPESIGDRIRSLRLQRSRSIRQLAAQAGISHTHLSRIEAGTRSVDNRHILASIAAALNVPLAELTAHTGGPTGTRSGAMTAMYRVMQAVVEADLDDTPLIEAVPLAPLLIQLEHLLDRRMKCDYTGAARIIPNLLAGLHSATGGPDRDAALKALVIAEDTTSFVIRYLGDPTASVLVADRTSQAATVLQDPVMLGMAAWGRAHALVGCGLHERASRIAETAAVGLEKHAHLPDAYEMLGQLYVLAGFARHAQGDISGSDTAIAEALRLAQRTGDTTTLGLYFGPTNVAFWQVGMGSEGDPGDAVQIARGIDPSGFAAVSRSRRTAFRIDTASALCGIRKDPEALRMILAAEREAPQRIRLSPVIAATCRTILERSNRGTGWTELRALCSRMDIPV